MNFTFSFNFIRKPSSKVSNQSSQKSDEKKKLHIKISVTNEGKEFDYEAMDLQGCNLDPKVTLFGVFQVGWTSFDVGSDGAQVYDYYMRAHYM